MGVDPVTIGLATAAVGAGMGALGSGKGEDAHLVQGSALGPVQKKIMRQFGPYITQRLGEGMEAWGPTAYPEEGEYVWGSGLSEYEELAQQLARNYAEGGEQQFVSAAEALKGMTPEETEAHFLKYISPAQERLLAKQLPGIAEQFVGLGTYEGSPRMYKMAEARSQFAEAQSAQLGDMIMGERAAGREMLPWLAQAAQAPLRGAQALMGVGGLERTLRDQEIKSRFAEFLRTRPELSPVVNQALAMLGLQTTTTYGVPYEPSWMEQIGPALVGAGGSIASA